MNGILVGGFGSESRGDDIAGLLAVRELRELGLAGVDVEEHADAASLAMAIARHAEVVIVDAFRSAEAPGSVVELAPEDVLPGIESSSHGLGVRHAVEIARALGSKAHVTVLGIGARCFDPGSAPDPEVARGAHLAVLRVKEMLGCA